MPSCSGTGGQQLVWLLATCTLFLFLSLLLLPPITHKLPVACVRLSLLSKKATVLQETWPRIFPIPVLGGCVLGGKVKQATNLIWFLFSTCNSFNKKRRGEAHGLDLMWCCSKTGALRLGNVHFWFTAASRELVTFIYLFPYFLDWYL